MLTPLIPVVVLFAIGALFRRYKGDLSIPLVELVIFVIFPAFVFNTIHSLHLDGEVFRVVVLSLLSVGVGGAIAFVVGKALDLTRSTIATMMLLASLGNTAFLGFGFVEVYYHDLTYAVIFDQIATMPMFVIYGTIVAAWGQGSNVNARQIAWRIFSFPPFLALLFGVVLNGVELPEILMITIDKLSVVLVPMILIAMGMKFDLKSLSGNVKNLSIVLVIKMVLVPFVIGLIAYFWGGINIASAIVILEASMPPMILAALLAVSSKLDSNLAISSIGFGMLLAFIISPIIFWVLGV